MTMTGAAGLRLVCRPCAWMLGLALLAAVIGAGCGGGATADTEPEVDLLAGFGALNGYAYVPISRAGAAGVRAVGDPTLSEAPREDTSEVEWRPLKDGTIKVDTGQEAPVGPEGAYWIPGVPIGKRKVRIEAPNPEDPNAMVSAEFDVEVQDRGVTSGTIPPSQATGTVGAVNGYVYVDAASSELMLRPGPVIGLTPASGALASLETGQSTSAESVGFFHLAAVPAGEHTLTVTYQSLTASFSLVVRAGATTSGDGSLPEQWGACLGYIGVPRAAQTQMRLGIVADPALVNAVGGVVVTLDSGERAVTNAFGRYRFTGVSPGVHRLTASKSGYLDSSGPLIVVPERVTMGLDVPAGAIGSVEVTSATGGLEVRAGSVLPLQAVAYAPDGAEFVGYDLFSWSSANTAVATVDASGVVTGVAPGTVNVAATAGGVSDTVQVVVTEAGGGASGEVAEVRLSHPQDYVEVGGTLQFTGEAYDTDGVAVPGATFLWGSTNQSAATVDANGLVTGLAQGRTSIVCYSEGISAAYLLDVIRGGQRLSVTPAVVVFADTENSRTLTITDADPTGGAALEWSLSEPAEAWLSATPLSGTGSGSVTLAVDRTGLAVGTYQATIPITSNFGAVSVTVRMTVSDTTIIITSAEGR